jgi:acetyl esterase/lipase
MGIRLAFLSLPALLMVIGCSSADVLNATITREGYTVTRDIAYGPDPRQKLDIYTPQHAQHAPVILFLYGGSWQKGSKDDYRFLGQAFASKGYVTAIADYRLYPQVYYPDFVTDGAYALKYIHAHAAAYAGNPDKIILAGHSAGAFNIMMLGADDRFHTAAQTKRTWIKAIIAIAGPYDFLPFTDDNIKALFSKAPDTETQPLNHITQKMAPVFLATGSEDDTVDPRNSHRVKAKLASLNSSVEEHVYPGIGHIGIILSLAEGFRWKAPLLDDIETFIHTTTDKK